MNNAARETEVRTMGMAVASVKGVTQSYQSGASETQSDDARVESTSGGTPAEVEQGTQQAETKLVSESLGISDADENNEAQQVNAQLKKAVEEINKNVHNSEAIFGIHEKTNRVTIKIVDKDTKKVIKEYPPEKTLDMIAKVWEMAGLMVDEKR
jgi:flagellar protein FlaG